MLPDYAEYDDAIGLDWYGVDPNLAQLLDRLLPDADDRAFAEEHVRAYGVLCGGDLARRAEVTDRHPPVLVDRDRWGFEIGAITHHPTWIENKADLVRAGFVGLPAHAGRPVPAVVTASLAYLVSQAETAIYCGLGMTAGAADVVERHAPEAVRDDFLRRLTSLDPDEAWEGGMFLTERQGGSDVGANTTRAVRDGDEWRLYGEKHFCSNVDADVFIVLARPDGAPEGPSGLATFIMPRQRDDGSPNGFHIRRLKPKLGTRGVPTAEVSLDGAIAWMAGQRATPCRERARPRWGGLNTHDGDGERVALRRRADGARHPPALVPRVGDLRRAPHPVGPAHRPLPDGARDARRPARHPRSRPRAHVRVRRGHPHRGLRRGRATPAPHPRAAGEGPRDA